VSAPTPPPVGRREFFTLEAGEYLERLDLLITGAGEPSGEDLVRFARALRGAALMAGPPGYAVASAGLENVAKAVRDGAIAWTPMLVERLGQSLEACRLLLRRVRDWSETDMQHCDRLANELDGLVGSAGRRPTASFTGAAGITPGVRAYVAREAAAVAATLEQVAGAVEHNPAPDSAEPVLQRLQPLRGLGALPGLSPLPELLEALDLTLAHGGRGGAWPPAAGSAFRATAGALARIARDIAELGIPQHDSHEIVQATELLREAFAREDDVIPVASLAPDGVIESIVQRGAPPAPSPAALHADPAMELVGLSDRLRHAVEQIKDGQGRAARGLQLHALVFALRGLVLSPPVGTAVGSFFCRLDREVMSGRALSPDAEIVDVMDRAAAAISTVEPGSTAKLAEALNPLCERLDRLGGIAPVVPIQALAPESDADVVPIESLFYDAVPAVTAPAPAPAYLAFEQTFSTYYRLVHQEPARARAGPVAPIETRAPEVAEAVPVQALLYRGRRALERADVVRRELDAALRVHRDLTSIETLLAELLDLVPLALDDDR